MQQHQQDQQQESMLDSMKRQFNIAIFICAALCAPLRYWLRQPGTAGTRSVGGAEVVGFFLPLLFAGSWTVEEGGWWLVGFWWLTLFLMIVSRVKGVQIRKRGYVSHSRYDGTPLLSFLGEEMKVKQNWEPLACIIAGAGLMPLSVPLGLYIVLAGFAHAIVQGYYADAERAWQQNMTDARIDMEIRAGRLRKGGDFE